MPTPNLATTTRYYDPEVTKCYFLPTVAVKGAPTRAEMNAGTNLSNEIADLEGWMVTSGEIPTPDLGTRFTKKIGGRTEAENSTLTMYATVNGADVRTLLPRNTTGFILWLDGGDVAGNKMDVFPVSVRSLGKMRSVGEDPARLQIQFSITAEPAESVAVPA